MGEATIGTSFEYSTYLQSYRILLTTVLRCWQLRRLKEALLRRYDFTEDWYCLRFCQCKPEPGESPVQLIYCLQNYLNEWMTLAHTGQERKGCPRFICELAVFELLSKGPGRSFVEKEISEFGRDGGNHRKVSNHTQPRCHMTAQSLPTTQLLIGQSNLFVPTTREARKYNVSYANNMGIEHLSVI